MSPEQDRMITLENLRPVSVVETTWPPAARVAVFEQVQSAAAEPAPQEVAAPMRRRLLIAAVLAAVLIPAGVGVATATGLLPHSFTRELSWWTSETHGGVDVQQAHRVAQGPGPDGRVLSVWTATGKDGTTCVSPIFEAPGDLTRPAPQNFALAGGQCPTPEQQSQQSFGNVGGSADGRGIHTMWGPMGAAVRAELHLADGTVRPVVYAENQFFCWYLADQQVAPPVLVGYDGAGQVVGRIHLPNLS